MQLGNRAATHLAGDFDVGELHSLESGAQSLEHRLFRSEAQRVVHLGTAALVAVLALLGREQTLLEARAALERRLHPVDLDDVDAQSGDHGYSTVTDLARLRGWSTLQSFSLAM